MSLVEWWFPANSPALFAPILIHTSLWNTALCILLRLVSYHPYQPILVFTMFFSYNIPNHSWHNNRDTHITLMHYPSTLNPTSITNLPPLMMLCNICSCSELYIVESLHYRLLPLVKSSHQLTPLHPQLSTQSTPSTD